MQNATKIVLLIMLASALLRLLGITWGVPFFDDYSWYYHPDEGKVTSGVVHFPRDILIRETFKYPTFLQYFTGLITLPVHAVTSVFNLGWDAWVASATLGARLVTLAMGVGTMFLTYRITERLFSAKTGVLAALLLGFSLYPVQNSAWASTDVVSGFFLAWFFLQIIRCHDQNWSRRTCLWAGVLLGAGIASKYTVALIPVGAVFIYLSAGWLGARSGQESLGGFFKRTQGSVLAAIIGTCVTFVLFVPAIVLKPMKVWSSIQYLADEHAPRHGSLWDIQVWIKSWTTMTDAMGWPMMVLFVVGVAVVLMRPRRLELGLLFTTLFLLAFFDQSLSTRYVIMFSPLLVIFAARGGEAIMAQSVGLDKPWVGYAVVGGVVIFSVLNCVSGAIMRHGDARIEALRYIDQQIPAQATVGFNYLTPRFRNTHPWKFPHLPTLGREWTEILDKPEYVVVHHPNRDRVLSKFQRENYFSAPYTVKPEFYKEWYRMTPPTPELFAFYERLYDPRQSEYQLVQTFTATPSWLWQAPIEFRSPGIAIYKRKG
ncbi:ArnT family glycosyltransferase [Magnetococcus sp. PR-3]|uniref:ArnT family glycosyltransferase n=1 Tax=Magnetococcus sp. PR-3 TaxID=3120355 RepID=UPI002FCDE445